MKDTTLLKQQLEKYYADFDISMGKGTGYYKQIEEYTGLNRKIFDSFKDLYERNNFLKVIPHQYHKIPKIIHQIWIGNQKIPKKLQTYQKTWIKHHADWEYKFWDNERVNQYNFANENLKFLFFKKSLTLGERVDILRYDILYKYGGIYADMDCLCLKSFDIFVHSYDFFAGIFPVLPASFESAIFLQNCLIGTKPSHPIIAKLSSSLLEKWEVFEKHEDEYLNTCERTFLALTKAALDEGGKDENIDLFLPPIYFFPLAVSPLLDIIVRGKKAVFLGLFFKKYSPYSSFHNNSFSNHYPHLGWLRDIYSTTSLKSGIWILFDLKHWILFLKAKLLNLINKEASKKLARQTFEEFMSRCSLG